MLRAAEFTAAVVQGELTVPATAFARGLIRRLIDSPAGSVHPAYRAFSIA
jgi:hypothetical protein